MGWLHNGRAIIFCLVAIAILAVITGLNVVSLSKRAEFDEAQVKLNIEIINELLENGCRDRGETKCNLITGGK